MGGQPELVPRSGKQKRKKVKKNTKAKGEPKYSLEEIVGNKDLLKKILMKKKSDPVSGQLPNDPKDEFGNNTEERILPRDYPGLETNKRNPLNREEKHKREIQSLLLIDAILEQTAQFTKKDKIVDFAKVKYYMFNFLIDIKQHSQSSFEPKRK